MTDIETLLRLGLALGIGFLIGLERGWIERDAGEGERAAGLRTFTLIAFSGGLFALLAAPLGQAAFAAGFIAMAAVVGLFRWREAVHDGSFGATTIVAALLTFALGAYAVVGSMTVAAAAGVATAAILAAKRWLHAWVRRLTWAELQASLIIATMSFVVLPILPDRGFGPDNAINLHDLWLMTIAIAGVSFIGYVALKVAGMRYGTLVAGIAGGVVSSTVTTMDLARRARQHPEGARFGLAGALAASATMFARVGVIVAVFGPVLLPYLVWPLGAALAITLLAAILIARPWRPEPDADAPETHVSNPFELRVVLGFGALLAVIMVLSAVLTDLFGGRGSVALAAIAGIADVDAITLSITRLTGGISLPLAALAVATAVVTNSISRAVLALSLGGAWFGIRYAAINAVALAAGGATMLMQSWG